MAVLTTPSVIVQTIRSAKQYTRGRNNAQQKVIDATSLQTRTIPANLLYEVANLTYNQQDFLDVAEMLDKRLNDKGKHWIHVDKSLTLIEHLILTGSDYAVIHFRSILYSIATLKEFQYIDDEGRDQGVTIRQKAKELSNLLASEERIREVRLAHANMRARLTGRPQQMPDESNSQPKRKPHSTNREEDDLKKALELSRQSALEEAEKNRGQSSHDKDIEEALRLSREEEEKQKRDRENANVLFDDGFDQNHTNQLQLVDTSLPFQQTGIQPQFSSFNPYLAAQQQQAEYLQHQQALEAQRVQMEQQAQYEQMMHQAAAMQQYQMYNQPPQLMPQMTAMPIQPQMTSFGSNNPFANFGQPQQATSSTSSTPAPHVPSDPPSSSFSFNDYGSLSTSSLPTNTTAATTLAASMSSLSNRVVSPPPPLTSSSPTPPISNNMMVKKDDGKNAKLAALLAQGGGIDTFGNEGALRVPVGSPFHPSNRVAAQQTGLNTFNNSKTNPFGQVDFGQTNPDSSVQQQQQDASPFFTL